VSEAGGGLSPGVLPVREEDDEIQRLRQAPEPGRLVLDRMTRHDG
jgi:hypothetical protein